MTLQRMQSHNMPSNPKTLNKMYATFGKEQTGNVGMKVDNGEEEKERDNEDFYDKKVEKINRGVTQTQLSLLEEMMNAPPEVKNTQQN